MAALHDLLNPAQWHTRAACASYDPELWWADHREDVGYKIAIDICSSCPVQPQCLEHALATPEREGIWGGLMPYERRRLAVHRREAVA